MAFLSSFIVIKDATYEFRFNGCMFISYCFKHLLEEIISFVFLTSFHKDEKAKFTWCT